MFFCNPEFCASGTGVRGPLVGRGRDDVTGENGESGTMPATTFGEVWRADAVGAFVFEELLHDAILKRVEADHCDPAAVGEKADESRQCFSKLGKFIVDGDSECLEGTSGWMCSGVTRSAAIDVEDGLDEVEYPVVRNRFPSEHDRMGDAASERLFAVLQDATGKLLFWQAIQQVRSGPTP